MTAAGVAKAKTLDLNERARRVTAWLESVAAAGGEKS